MLLRRSLLLFLLAGTAAPALAQEDVPPAEDEYALDETDASEPIIVTAAGLDEPRSEVAYGAVTLDGEAIAREPSGRLENILSQVAGVELFRVSDSRSGHPTGQGVTLRGLGGNASSRALLVLDGVPQSDPFGGWIAWPGFDAEQLGEIKVVRGGGSGVFGPGALAGTIELASLSVENFEPARASLAYGSRDSIETGVGIMLPPSENSLLDVSIHHERGDGFIPIVEGRRGPADIPARYETYGGTFRIAAPLAGSEFQFAARYFHDERSRGFAFGDNRTRGFDGSVRLLGRGRLPWEALLYVQDRDFRSSFASLDANRTTASQVLDQFSVPATGIGGRFEIRPTLPGDAAELRLGADFRRTEGETNERFFFVAGEPTRLRSAGGETLTLGGFADATVRLAPELTATGSARLDRWSISDGFFAQRNIGGGNASGIAYPDRDGWQFTGRAGLAWQPRNELTVRTAGYTGWRLPTLNELFRPFRVGDDVTGANAALAPEELAGIEAGVDYTPATFLNLSGTVFYNRLSDAIANVTLGQGPGVFPDVGFVPGAYRQRRNLDAIESAGFELDALARFAEWSFRLSYAFTDAEVDASGPAAPLDGLRPAQTPRHSASATLGWSREFGPDAALTLRYIGSRFEDDLNQLRLDDALVVGARAVIPVYSLVSLELRAENIFDARIEAANQGNGLIERAMPQTFWAGLRFSLF